MRNNKGCSRTEKGYGFVLIVIGPDTLAEQDKRQSEGFPFNVFCSFFDGGFKFCAPSNTLTAQVPNASIIRNSRLYYSNV